MKVRILIAGIGGVGGWFGGLLAKAFFESDEVEIIFLARGQHLNKIREHGLKVVKGADEFVVKPALATNDTAEIGPVDYILLCTKSYDLDNTLLQLAPCINNDTVIIPFLNGVDSTEKIKTILPQNLVTGGCVYIVSSIAENGVIINTGNIQKLFFGLDNDTNDKLILLEKILLRAGIEATLTQDISSVVWEKFYLVGANSTATSYFDSSVGEIFADEVKAQFLFSLLEEIDRVAVAKGIPFKIDVKDATIKKLRSFPYDAISSMQRDFRRADGKTELETITGYIVRAGKELNIPVPYFNTAYKQLKERNGQIIC